MSHINWAFAAITVATERTERKRFMEYWGVGRRNGAVSFTFAHTKIRIKNEIRKNVAKVLADRNVA